MLGSCEAVHLIPFSGLSPLILLFFLATYLFNDIWRHRSEDIEDLGVFVDAPVGIATSGECNGAAVLLSQPTRKVSGLGRGSGWQRFSADKLIGLCWVERQGDMVLNIGHRSARTI